MLDIDPQTLIGGWRRFGAFGPSYQVIGIDADRTTPSETWMLIRVLHTDEETGYPLSQLLDDPVEA